MFAFFGLGAQELVILLAVGLQSLLGLIVAFVVVALTRQRERAGPRRPEGTPRGNRSFQGER